MSKNLTKKVLDGADDEEENVVEDGPNIVNAHLPRMYRGQPLVQPQPVTPPSVQPTEEQQGSDKPCSQD